ncbi:MAG: putative sulfate exporter family transporter [Phycisphaerales bacterium]|nr:putative sulfate exporter family transporter [Phycisphaerales bacterium]
MPVDAQPSPSAIRLAGEHPFRVLLFAIALAATLHPRVGPPHALALGIVIALGGFAAFASRTRKWSKLLIQVGVVLLGFRMDLHKVLEAGVIGVAFAAGTIAMTFALGVTLGGWLAIDRKVTTLVSCGTAICGGSAIAATGAVIAATEAQIAVAMGCVFVLNAIGLYIFPPLGEMMHLSANQFGTWAAVAIHDVSSVVGAASVFDASSHGAAAVAGGTALESATAVKLSRTLWIAPIALAAGWWFRRAEAREADPSSSAPTRRAVPPLPWFIGLFLLASLLRSFVPEIAGWSPTIEALAKKVLTVALLLIGLGMSRKAIASVGWRAMALAVALWVAISVVALVVVRQTVT